MASKDYIKLYRSLLDWEWFNDGNVLHLWVYILLKANWKDKRFKGEIIPRGSFITTYEQMMIETGMSKQEIRTALGKLLSTGEISKKVTSHQQVITVEKYTFLQDVTQESNISSTLQQHLGNISSTPIKEEYKNGIKTNSDIQTNTDQKTNKDRKTNNVFIKPSLEEVQDYITEKGYHFTAEQFIDHYESNGWMVGKVKMKDWRAACRTWERNHQAKPNEGFSWLEVERELERKTR